MLYWYIHSLTPEAEDYEHLDNNELLDEVMGHLVCKSIDWNGVDVTLRTTSMDGSALNELYLFSTYLWYISAGAKSLVASFDGHNNCLDQSLTLCLEHMYPGGMSSMEMPLPPPTVSLNL